MHFVKHGNGDNVSDVYANYFQLSKLNKECHFIKKEKNAIIWALWIILILFFILGGSYYGVQKNQIYQQDDKERDTTSIDILNIVGSFAILFVAFIYWLIFYAGKWGFTRTNIKSHCTEAFLMYSFLYMLGIGLLMPTAKIAYFDNKEYNTSMYPYYPLVFTCMMFGYYLYEYTKFCIEHNNNPFSPIKDLICSMRKNKR